MARGYSGSSDAARVRPPAKVPAYVPVSDDQRADAAWTPETFEGRRLEFAAAARVFVAMVLRAAAADLTRLARWVTQ